MADPDRILPIDIARAAVAVLPAAICWGASFPLAVACAADPAHDPGRLMGDVYAANTVGAILGASSFGVLFVPWIGTVASVSVLVVASAIAALLVIQSRRDDAPSGRLRLGFGVTALVLCGLALATLQPVPASLQTLGRHAPESDPEQGEILYVGEGLSATVAVTEHADSIRAFRIQGKVAASNAPADMVLQRMLGHYSAILHGGPKSVLIVGFGAGVTAGTFVVHPGIERIVICEIEALTTEGVGPYFAVENHGILDDPRVEIVHDDARHFLLTTDERFDVITSDPIHPWVKGAATLYTEEYFELARERLRPGGVITQWVPLYESTLPAVRSELATFFGVFPRATLWSSHFASQGFDVVMAARPDGMRIDLDELRSRLTHPDHERVRESLGEVGIGSVEELVTAFLAWEPDMAEWLATAEVNHDRDLRLMYLAGLGLNQSNADEIHAELMRYRAFPEGLIVADPAILAETRRAMAIDIR